MNSAAYYRALRKQPSFKHSAGISMAVQSLHNFTPTPNYTPAEIAYFKGLDARKRGRPESDNTYDTQPNLSAEWMRGYGE
jgi:hypothetical protein